MSEFRIAHRYAKSLIDLGVEKNAIEKLNEDVKLFAETISESRDLVLLLKSPIIPSQKKKAVIDAVFGGKIGDIFASFLEIVLRKGREAYLPLMAKKFESLYNDLKGIQKASVTTTFKLDKKLRKDFTDAIASLTSKKVELTENIDEDLIGGFVLTLGDRQIDASVSSKLKTLKRNLIDQSYTRTI